MKRIIALILTFLMCFQFICIPEAVYADNVINIEVQSATADAVEYTVTSKADNTMNLLIYECFYDYSGRYAIMSNKSVIIAENEIKCANEYDYICINDDISECARDIVTVIKAQAFTNNKMKNFVQEVEKDAKSFNR